MPHDASAVRLEVGSWQARCSCGWQSRTYEKGQYTDRMRHAAMVAETHNRTAKDLEEYANAQVVVR
jgi:hypothetical protein